jgi:hypothetical protein
MTDYFLGFFMWCFIVYITLGFLKIGTDWDKK